MRAATDPCDLIGLVDAVSVAVPTSAHHEVARLFLEQGVHVLLEKPIASDLAQADELIRCARANGRILQVGHLERFFAIETGLIDAVTMPVYIEAVRVAPFQPRGNDVSVVLDLMIHDIDLITVLVRAPVADVDAVGSPILSDHEDIVNTRLRFENGCVANITASRVAFKSERRMRIFQPDSLLSVDLLKRHFATVRKNDAAAIKAGAASFVLYERELSDHDALRAELRSFLTAVATGTPPVVSGEDGRAALEIGNRIIESLQRHAALVRKRIRAAEASRPREAQLPDPPPRDP